jgi:hypothetical protein
MELPSSVTKDLLDCYLHGLICRQTKILHMPVTRQFLYESIVHHLNQKCRQIVSILKISVTICSEPHLSNISTNTHIKPLNTCYNTTDITSFTLLTITSFFSYKIKHGGTEIRMGSNEWFLFQYTQNVIE